MNPAARQCGPLPALCRISSAAMWSGCPPGGSSCRRRKAHPPASSGTRPPAAAQGQPAAAMLALGALLDYLHETQKTDLEHVDRLDYYRQGQFMELDLTARRNLELTETLRGKEKKGSLLWVLDKTKTAMGARLLRSWLEQPLLSVSAIARRSGAVAAAGGAHRGAGGADPGPHRHRRHGAPHGPHRLRHRRRPGRGVPEKRHGPAACHVEGAAGGLRPAAACGSWPHGWTLWRIWQT
ncbi:MAG: hypothetical protein ACLU38_15790 [Dysosmobacter sp.]